LSELLVFKFSDSDFLVREVIKHVTDEFG
jgi:hypothetical protein